MAAPGFRSTGHPSGDTPKAGRDGGRYDLAVDHAAPTGECDDGRFRDRIGLRCRGSFAFGSRDRANGVPEDGTGRGSYGVMEPQLRAARFDCGPRAPFRGALRAPPPYRAEEPGGASAIVIPVRAPVHADAPVRGRGPEALP